MVKDDGVELLTDLEKAVAHLIQGDLPLAPRPFAEIAREAGCSEDKVLQIIQDLMARGVIRKVGAIIRHQKAGITQNAMVVWAVPTEDCERVGTTLSAFSEVTHCYLRSPAFLGKYNLFTMTHLQKGDHPALMARLSAAAGVGDFLVLFSEEEYKKSSMEYF